MAEVGDDNPSRDEVELRLPELLARPQLARENELGLFFLGIFVLTLAGQSFAGQRAFNADQRVHGDPTLS